MKGELPPGRAQQVLETQAVVPQGLSHLVFGLSQDLGDRRERRVGLAQVQLDLVSDHCGGVLGVGGTAAAVLEERFDDGQQVRVLGRHCAVQVGTVETDRVGSPAVAHGRAEQLLAAGPVAGAFVLEAHLERAPRLAVRLAEDVAEHAERQLRVLPPVGDALVDDLVAQPHQLGMVDVADDLEVGEVLVDREVPDHALEPRVQRRARDRDVADDAELVRLKLPAERQAEALVSGLARGLLEQGAVLVQVQLVERVVDVVKPDQGLVEDLLDVAVAAPDQVRHARGGGSQHLGGPSQRCGRAEQRAARGRIVTDGVLGAPLRPPGG